MERQLERVSHLEAENVEMTEENKIDGVEASDEIITSQPTGNTGKSTPIFEKL